MCHFGSNKRENESNNVNLNSLIKQISKLLYFKIIFLKALLYFLITTNYSNSLLKMSVRWAQSHMTF